MEKGSSSLRVQTLCGIVDLLRLEKATMVIESTSLHHRDWMLGWECKQSCVGPVSTQLLDQDCQLLFLEGCGLQPSP